MAKSYLVHVWSPTSEIIQFSTDDYRQALRQGKEIARGNSKNYFDEVYLSIKSNFLYLYYAKYTQGQFFMTNLSL